MPSYTYQWRRCNNVGASCADIVGETASTYVQTATDIGSTLRCVVSDGTTTVTSAASAIVASAASGVLYLNGNFDAATMESTPSPPSGASWPTMPGTVPDIVGPFSFRQPYTPPATREGYQDGLETGTKALRLRLKASETIAAMGGTAYSWGGITNGAEFTDVGRWQSGGSPIGYRLGQTDYYLLRVRFVSVTDTYSFAQLGYPVVHYSNIALRTYSNQIGLNQESGFSANPSPGHNEKSIFHKNITPGGGNIVLNRWYDILVKVKWATDNTGELMVSSRAPELSATWQVMHNETGIPTQQWGNTIEGGYVNQDGGTRQVTDKLSLYRGAGGADMVVDYNRFLIGSTQSVVETAL